MHYTLYIFLLIIICTFFSCQSSIIEPLNNEPSVKILSIIPERDIKVGEKFQIILKSDNFDTLIVSSQIYCNDLWHYADSINTDKIFAYVPFIPTNRNTWAIRLAVFNNSFNNQPYTLIDTIKVIPELFDRNIFVKWTDIEQINKVESFYYRYGQSYGWLKEEVNDTIIIYQVRPGCDEGAITSTFKFLNKGNNNIPELLEFTKIETCLHNVYSDTLSKGIVKIQEWNNNIKCGLLFPEIKDINERAIYPHKIIFWVDQSN